MGFYFLLLTRVRNKGSLKRRDADVGIVSRLFSPRLSRTRVIWYLYDGCWLGLYKCRKSVRVGAARILIVFWVGVILLRRGWTVGRVLGGRLW